MSRRQSKKREINVSRQSTRQLSPEPPASPDPPNRAKKITHVKLTCLGLWQSPRSPVLQSPARSSGGCKRLPPAAPWRTRAPPKLLGRPSHLPVRLGSTPSRGGGVKLFYLPTARSKSFGILSATPGQSTVYLATQTSRLCRTLRYRGGPAEAFSDRSLIGRLARVRRRPLVESST